MLFRGWFFRRRRSGEASELWKRQQPAVAMARNSRTEQRAYLPDAPYLLPKDVQEDERLRFQHYALYQAFGNHYLAPLSPETRTILDVGTGTVRRIGGR